MRGRVKKKGERQTELIRQTKDGKKERGSERWREEK